jgi:hypothetical protein
MKIRKVSVSVLILFFSFHSNASVITTVADGYWSDSAVWSGGMMPGFSVSDTVEINHCILYYESLQLNPGAFLTIKDSGKICGHHNIYMKPGSEFDVFGRVYYDTLFVQGYFYLKNNLQAWVAQLTRVTAPGHALIIGPAGCINYIFTYSCEYDSILSQSTDTITAAGSNKIEVYPNPFTEAITVKTIADIDLLDITDNKGRLILRRKFTENYLYLKNLPAAAYFLNFKLKNGEIIRKKVMKI